MTNAQLKILQLLEEGKITAEEADRLLNAIPTPLPAQEEPENPRVFKIHGGAPLPYTPTEGRARSGGRVRQARTIAFASSASAARSVAVHIACCLTFCILTAIT